MTRSERAPAILIAGSLAFLDAGARFLIALRLEQSILPALVALPVASVLALLLLRSAVLARPDGLMLAVPIAGLLTIGDIVAARLSVTSALSHQELAAAGAIVMFVVTLAIVRRSEQLERLGELLGMLGCLLIALPLAPMLGHTIGGQAGWARLAGLQVSPGELGRPLVLLGLAATLVPLGVSGRQQLSWVQARPILRRALMLPVLAVAIHLVERDLGAALLLTLAVGGTVAVATNNLRWFVLVLAGATTALAAGAMVTARLHERVRDVFDPLRVVDGHFDQAGLAHLALSWGGWHGVGFGGGLTIVERGAVPAASSDYVLAQWVLEAGLVGLLIVMALFAWLLATAWTWTLRAPAGFPRLSAAGLTWLLTISITWTTGAQLGLLPLSGLPSPGLSGASNAIALGICGALLCRTDPQPYQRTADAQAARTLRLVRIVAVSAVVGVALLATHRISTTSTDNNRLAHNTFLMWSALKRGDIVSRDGVTLASTTGAASQDTIARRQHATKLSAAIVGRVTFGNQTGGIENAWRGLLRCGGSGQSQPIGTAWSGGAPGIDGDPARCQPMGLRISLDLGVQRAAQHALEGVHGAVVVMDARTGAVLASAARLGAAPPASSLAPLTLLAAPGSTFKIVTAAAALQFGAAIDTPLARGYTPEGGRWLANAGDELCGGSLLRAFATSCNSSFARMGTELGTGRLLEMARRFGFERRTAVSGLTSSLSTMNADRGLDSDTLASASIGQGAVVATPLQMAVAAATVATGGLRPTPTLVDGICGGSAAPSVSKRVISPDIARTLRAAMRITATAGTAVAAAQAPGAWALKTGTAELPLLRQASSPAGTGGWITGFATSPTSSGVLPVIAGVVLPDATSPRRSGPSDGASLITALAPAAMAAHAARAGGCS